MRSRTAPFHTRLTANVTVCAGHDSEVGMRHQSVESDVSRAALGKHSRLSAQASEGEAQRDFRTEVDESTCEVVARRYFPSRSGAARCHQVVRHRSTSLGGARTNHSVPRSPLERATPMSLHSPGGRRIRAICIFYALGTIRPSLRDLFRRTRLFRMRSISAVG